MAHKPHARHEQLGGKVGPRIADVVSKAMSDHAQRTQGLRAKVHAEGLNEFFRGMSREKRQHTTPAWEMFIGHPETPPEVEKLLRFIAHGQGELSEVMGALGMGQAVGTSILAALQNYLAPLNQQLIQVSPQSLIDPGTVAGAHIRGLMDTGSAQAEAAKGGINAHRLSILEHLAVQFPSITQLLEMWRRGLISDVMVREAMRRAGVSGEFTAPLLNMKREHLAPADAALMHLKGIMSTAEGHEVAGIAGLTPGDFDKLVLATGEPPGLEQLLFAYRRGFIDKPRLDKGIKQSRVRDEWSDVIERLRFTPASASDALRGVIQGHLSEAEGKQIAEWDGLRPEDWGWLVKTEGNPPGVEQMLHLWNRGKVTTQQVDEAIKESRLKNKYIGPVKHLAVTLPQGRQVVTMLSRGALSHKRAMEVLHDLGYEPDIAQALLDSAVSAQVGREKILASGQITELYHDHAITEAAAIKALKAIGYHEGNAKLILRITDLKRERALQTAALSPIRSAYVARHITEQQASGDIDKLGIPAKQRDYLLVLWSIERDSHRRTLTEAQVIAANVKGLFTDEVTLTRLEQLGYTREDARVLVDLEKKRTTYV
jgi:hypothetical protein